MKQRNSHSKFYINRRTMLKKSYQSLFIRKNIWPFITAGIFVLTIGFGLSSFLVMKDQAHADPISNPAIFYENPDIELASCEGESECFAFTIDTRLDATGGLTRADTTFAIPTSNASPYNWIINWGDGTANQTISGSGSTGSAGVSHTYPTTGTYRITIRPVTVTAGWFRAFGFYPNFTGANSNTNKYKFKAINTPFTNLMRFASSTIMNDTYRYLLYDCRNGEQIPAKLFSKLDTSNGTSFNYMFYNTFYNYAQNSTTATIPTGLFDSIDTSSGTNFGSMFIITFYNYSTRTPTFIRSSDQASHTGSSFSELYAVSVNGGAPATSPTVTAGSTIKPSYNTTTRTINPPSAVSGLTWYRTDGTSCLIANPTENCGAQNASSLVTFPNTTEWTPETSTEKGNVSFYSRIVTDIVMSNSDIGEWHSPGYVVGQFETTASPSYPGFTYTLVPDNGDDLDNSAFTISGSNLILNTTPNYDAQPIYYINIQTTDANGNTFIKRFELNVVEADEVVPDPGTETPNSDIGLGSPNTGFMKLDETKNDHIKFWFISLVVLSVVAGTIAKFLQHRSLNHKRSK